MLQRVWYLCSCCLDCRISLFRIARSLKKRETAVYIEALLQFSDRFVELWVHNEHHYPILQLLVALLVVANGHIYLLPLAISTWRT